MRDDQRERDEDAFAWFFTTEYPAVVRLLSVVVRDSSAAEDLAQDAFIRLHRHWAKISRYEHPEAWVRRVALNRAFSHLRLVRRRDTVVLLPEHDVPEDRDGAADADVHEAVVRAVHSLPRRQAALVGLYHLEDRPLAEVAEVLGMTEGATKVALHRARRRLAELLTEKELSS